jgi:GAF domain-containing protein
MSELTELLDGLAHTMDMVSDDADLQTALTRVCDTACHLLPVDSASIGLLDSESLLRLSALSGDLVGRVAVEQVLGGGPCAEAAARGTPVMADRSGLGAGARWPELAGAAGMHTAVGWPVRAGASVVGALCLFGREPLGFSDADVSAASLLAGVAGVCVVDHRRRERAERMVGQLQYALAEHAVIEQAKGMLVVQLVTSADQAFEVLRRHARHHNRRVIDVARAVASGQRLFLDPGSREPR